jgi:hypothetical protein
VVPLNGLVGVLGSVGTGKSTDKKPRASSMPRKRMVRLLSSCGGVRSLISPNERKDTPAWHGAFEDPKE